MNFKRTVVRPSAQIKLAPNNDSPLETECLFGEQVNILDEKKEWFKCQNFIDGYNGWIKKSDLCFYIQPTHRVISSRSFIHLDNDVKSNILHYLPMGSKLKILNLNKKWSEIQLYKNPFSKIGFVPTNHIVTLDHISNDWVSIAENLIDTPYKWGGKDTIGIDCSALIQLSLETIGVNFPRNTKDQENFHKGINFNYNNLQRGVLVFWNGHVGVMINKKKLLHSNGFFMSTIVEDIKVAEKRISYQYGNIKKIITKFKTI
jgi:hypothetical protein